MVSMKKHRYKTILSVFFALLLILLTVSLAVYAAEASALSAELITDKEARCGKRDERAEEHDELNAHSSDAVGNYLFVGDIFAQGGCFPVQYDIVPCRADLFLEITLSHFNTPSGPRRSRENTPADSCFSPRYEKNSIGKHRQFS